MKLKKHLSPNKTWLRVSRDNVERTAALIVGTLLVAIGLHSMWLWHAATHHKNPLITAHSARQPSGTPDETPITTTNYNVPPTQPRQIVIKSVGIKGYIQEVDIDSKGAVGVPGNIHLAGWYSKSPLPGDKGISIIDGHVHGYYSSGIFKNLASVKAGNQIDIEFGNHSWRHFRALSNQAYPDKEASYALYDSVTGVTNQLTLITCGGTFNRATHSYEARVIVRATSL